MKLKKYQEKAVKELLIETQKCLSKEKYCSLVFKAPTGSGKTVMMQEFLRLFTENTFDEKYAFIWISVNDLSSQSKKSFEKNLVWSKLIFSEFSDIKDKIFRKNEILFINWEKIRTIDKETWEWKVLAMKENETGENLPNYLENTHDSGIKIILIVDESHRSLNTEKAQDLIQNYIKPTLQIEVSATPDSTDYEAKIEVEIIDVIDDGMIKKEVVINPNLKNFYEENFDTDEYILKMALKKQEELKNLYKKISPKIKPLILVQLPSETKKETELDKTKIARVIEILNLHFDINFENKKLAIWLSNDKTNRDLIDEPNSPVEVLIFKQAIATGWDCPRAQILVMFRDIKTPTFEIQTIGRVLRMPEAKHYENHELNTAYIFTDLEKWEIAVAETAKNIIKIHIANRREDIFKKFYLDSFYKSREDYGDIWFSFYEVLTNTLISEINGSKEILSQIENLEKLSEKINVSDQEVKNEILSDGKILIDIDERSGEKIIWKYSFEAKTSAEIIKLAFDNFIRNEVWPQFKNIARSYKAIIEALYFAFDNYFFGKKKSKLFYQKLVLNHKNFFVKLLDNAKNNYLPIRKKEISQKKQNSSKNFLWEIPKNMAFSEKSEICDYKKNIFEPCFVDFDSKEEKYFIENFLEKSDLVQFWFKNGVNSEQFLWIPYEDENDEIKTFYPDFLVYFKNWVIWIFDTKGGFTLSAGKNKAKWLEKFERKNIKNGKKIIAGFIESKHIENTDYFTFRINKTWDYNLQDRNDFEVFDDDFIANYSFENISIFDEKYKDELENSLKNKFSELKNLEEEYKNFIDEQEKIWDFDFEKREEMLVNIANQKEKIKDLQKEISKIF